MEEGGERRDPEVALRACIAAFKDGTLQREESGADRLEQCLCLLQESLRGRDNDVDQLQRALENSEKERVTAVNCVERLRREVEGLSKELEELRACWKQPSVVGSLEGKEGGGEGRGGGRDESCGEDGQKEAKDKENEEEWSGQEKGNDGRKEGGGEEEEEKHTQQAGVAADSHEPVTSMDSDTHTLPKHSRQDVGGMATEVEPASDGMAEQEHAQPSTEATSTGMEEDGEYQKMEFPVLYYHSATGYYYDPATQQFFSPVTSNYEQTAQTGSETGQSSWSTSEAQQSASGTKEGTSQLRAQSDSYSYQTGQTGSQTGKGTSVADILAAASEKASQKCGYVYDEATGLYYDNEYGMYYDQDTQLYYDPEKETYYEFDVVTRQYQFHSKAKQPKKPKRQIYAERKEHIDLCSSDSEPEYMDSPEEGEIRVPKLPRGSPPPEDEWAPCLRMVVSSSECVERGSVFVVTQEGAELGREPGGSNGIPLPEVLVSKSHVEIRYSKSRKCFTVCDKGSRNGTIINDKRLSEPKEQSRPHPLTHCDTLTVGSTTFTVHIHTGWETCEWCRWEERGGGGRGGGGGGGGVQGEAIKSQWKKELNRIRKRYGLRMKDTYGEEPKGSGEGYQDRAAVRRKKVGSDQPEMTYRDAPPSSVHTALPEQNVGHKMLKKLGWKEGEGLGRENKGIREPIKADVRDERSGLGSKTFKRSLDSAGDESSAANKHRRMMKHYSEVVAREEKKSKH